MDTYPRVVAFAETRIGKVLLLLVFAALLRPINDLWLPITIGAGACAFAGKYRAPMLAVATLSVLIAKPGWFGWTAPTLIAAREGAQGWVDVRQLRWIMPAVVFVMSAAAILCVRRFPDLILARRPVLTLVATFFVLLLGAQSLPAGSSQVLCWSFLATFAAYFWFLCYALADQRSKSASPVGVQLGTFHPFWGSTFTPFGKGAAYLRKVDSKTPLDLAVTQLKGVKLLAWALLLGAICRALRIFALDILHIPTFDAAFARHVTHDPYPWYLCWGSIIYRFCDDILVLAIWGHGIVAAGRMAGYRLLRNTYRPLSARTLAEFWNRYYYYFKELLVDCFFFPTFLRYFKQHPRLRLFFATFMAAAAGNFIYHFMRDNHRVAQSGMLMTLAGFQTYAFYCVVLGTAIGLSQMRSRRNVHHGWLRGQLLPSLGVMLFYCLMEVFMDTYSPYSLKQHLSFLLHLFGGNVWA